MNKEPIRGDPNSHDEKAPQSRSFQNKIKSYSRPALDGKIVHQELPSRPPEESSQDVKKGFLDDFKAFIEELVDSLKAIFAPFKKTASNPTTLREHKIESGPSISMSPDAIRQKNRKWADQAMAAFYSNLTQNADKKDRARSKHFIDNTPLLDKQGLSQDYFYAVIAAQHYIDLNCQSVNASFDEDKKEDEDKRFRFDGIAKEMTEDILRANYTIGTERLNRSDKSKENKENGCRKWINLIRGACQKAGINDEEKVKNIVKKISMHAYQKGSGCIGMGLRFLKKDVFENYSLPKGQTQSEINYILTHSEDNIIQLDLSVSKTGFAFLYKKDPNDPSREPQALNCDSRKSFIKQGASIRFLIKEDGDLDIFVDRVDNQANIVQNAQN